MHNYAKIFIFPKLTKTICVGILYDLVYGGLRTWHGRGTGRNKVLKLNCYIVVDCFYLQDLVYVLVVSLLRHKVKGWGAVDIRGGGG